MRLVIVIIHIVNKANTIVRIVMLGDSAMNMDTLQKCGMNSDHWTVSKAWVGSDRRLTNTSTTM